MVRPLGAALRVVVSVLVAAPIATGTAAAGATRADRATTTVSGLDTTPVIATSSVTDRFRVRTGRRYDQRRVILERRRLGGTGWIATDRGRTTATGRFRAELHPGGIGTWQFRVIVRPTDSARRFRSLPRLVTMPSPIPDRPAIRWRAASAGGSHTCAVASSTRAFCWGYGGYGALGNGGTGRSLVPTRVTVSGALEGRSVSDITAGRQHTCALDGRGHAFCWGEGSAGQLGDDRSTDSKVPVPVDQSALELFTAISAGGDHTCGLTADGRVSCWGDTQATPSPVDLPRRTVVTRVTAGAAHTCALTDDGEVLCWGSGADGRLGDGSGSDSAEPVTVPLGAPATSVSAGSRHTCATTAAGAVLCWGAGDDGRLGTGNTDSALLPTPTLPAPFSVEVVAGDSHTCARTWTNDVYCWGRNRTGQVGDGTTVDRFGPVLSQISFGPAVTALTTGSRHSCAIDVKQVLQCWGQGVNGELGANLAVASVVPLRVSEPVN